MTIPVPSLSSSGWVTEIAEKTDKLLSYFFVSEESQTNLYHGQITSLPALLQRYSRDEFELSANIQLQLTRYLERYYERADVSVRIRENDSASGDRGLDLEIDIIVTDQGRNYSVGRLVSTLNASIMKIADLNNRELE